MKSKTKVKTHKIILSNTTQKQQNKQPLSKQTILKNITKQLNQTKKMNSKKEKADKIPVIKNKNKSSINTEDSSTNCLSGDKGKKIYLNSNQKKEDCFIPFIISDTKDSETESFFINFKLGEKDSYLENLHNNVSKHDKKTIIKKINLKNMFNYCKVNKESGKYENDSLELYDFNDKTNVEYILKNLSLNCDKSGINDISNILEDCNEEKECNIIKIFETKQNKLTKA